MSYVKADSMAFGIPIPLEVWEAQSTLGNADPIVGRPVASARANGRYPQWRLAAAGPQTAASEVQVEVTSPGFAPLAGVVVREASDTNWLGRDTQLLRTRSEPLAAGGTPLPLRLAPHGVVTPSGARICAFTRQVSGGAYAVVICHRAATATSWTTVVVATGLSTTALAYPALIVMGEGVQLFHYVIDDNNNQANIDVYQTLDDGATWARSARAVLQSSPIDLSAYTLGRLRGAYKDGQVLLLAGVTSTDAGADPREFTNQYASADNGAHFMQISAIEYCAFPDVVVYDGRFVCGFANEASGFLQAKIIANAYSDLSITPFDTATALWDQAFAHEYNAMVTIAVNVVTDCDHALAVNENGCYWLARTASTVGSSEMSCQIVRIVGPITNRDIHNMGESQASSTYGVWWLQDAGQTATDYPVAFCAWGWRGNIQVAANWVSNATTWDDQIFLHDIGGNSSVTQPYWMQIATDYAQTAWLETYFPSSLPTIARYGWAATGAGTANITSDAGWLYISTTANQLYYQHTLTPNEAEIRHGGYFKVVSGGSVAAREIIANLRLGQAALGFEVEIWFSATQARLRDVNAGTTIATVDVDTTGGVYYLLALNESGECYAAVAAARNDGGRLYLTLANGDAMTDDGGAGGTDNIWMFGHRVNSTSESKWSEVNRWWESTAQSGMMSLADGQTNPDDLSPIPLAANASTYTTDEVLIRARGGPMLIGDTWSIPASSGAPQRALLGRGYEGSASSVRGGQYPSPRQGCVATATTGRWAFKVPSGAEQRFPRGCLIFDFQRSNCGTWLIEGYASGAWSTIATAGLQATGLTFAREGTRLRITSTGTTYLNTNALAGVGYVKMVSGLNTFVRPVSHNTGGLLTSASSLTPVVTIDIDPASYTGTEPASGDLTIYYGRGTVIVPSATTAQYSAFCVRQQTAPDTYEATPQLGKFTACEGWFIEGADWGTARIPEMGADIEELNNGATRGKVLRPIRDVRELPFARIMLDALKGSGAAEWVIQTGGAVVGLDGNEVEILEGMFYELGQGTIPGVMVPYVAANGGTRTLTGPLAGVYGRPRLEEFAFTLEAGTEGSRYQAGSRLLWRGEL